MKLRFGWGPADGAAGMQRNVDLVRTVRETVGDDIDIMADAYMGWTLDYARRMLPLLAPFNFRWLEEPVIPDDLHGYAALKAMNLVPIAGGEHALHGARVPRSARSAGAGLHSVRHESGRRHFTGAQDCGARGSRSVPVVPHAGQMHNYHVVMASLNSPMAEYFPPVDVEVGNELFYYIFEGEPTPVDGQSICATMSRGWG